MNYTTIYVNLFKKLQIRQSVLILWLSWRSNASISIEITCTFLFCFDRVWEAYVWYVEPFLRFCSLNSVFSFFAGWGEQNCSFFLLKQHFIPLCSVESLTRYGLYQQCRLQSVGSHWNQTIGKYLACTQIIQVNVQDLGRVKFKFKIKLYFFSHQQ